MITLIVARARNGAIGRDGDIPWHAPEDLNFFQRETLGGAIIMGRNTWDSLPVKPLPRRFNLVVSSRSDAAETVVSSVAEGIAVALRQGISRIYGIGGAGIYTEMLPLADRLLITEVDLEIADADTFFPVIEDDQWQEISQISLRAASPKCDLREFARRR
jgi:dihydrofolate reductase